MKKFFVALIGGTVLALGLALVVLPGPGMVVMAGGLAILATEYIWARRALRNGKGVMARIRRRTGLRTWWRRRQYGSSQPCFRLVRRG